MNKADVQFKKAITKILNDGVWDKNPRPVWSDGTPAHSKFLTQYVERYDISKNEFPITTIKPTAWKTGIREMFWIYQEQSNDLNIARDKYGINWWDDWNVGDNSIGYRYGHTVKRYDLMNKLLNDIINNPYGRRHIISLWQEEEFTDENYFATGNKNKMTEIRQILRDLGMEILSMKEAGVDIDIVEDGKSFEENAMIKASAIAELPEVRAMDAIVLADDSGLEIDALNKEPGVYSARYMGEDTSYDVKKQKSD